jgi:hypothetical protein
MNIMVTVEGDVIYQAFVTTAMAKQKVILVMFVLKFPRKQHHEL